MTVSAMKFIRFRKGLTQLDLWQLTGIPQWRISLIERGLMPKDEEAGKIAKALGCSVEDVFSNTAGDVSRRECIGVAR